MHARKTLLVSGTDAENFLQGLITNDMTRLKEGQQYGLIYAALLTPQGKYLADFFVSRRNGAILLDIAEPLAAGFTQRLTMYRLRAAVDISEAGLQVHVGTGSTPEDGFGDPRHPDLGWRAYRTNTPAKSDIDWDVLRVAHCIPESGIELTTDSYILESGFERINGVDFKKGCYVGQEVTARMKHKTELRKGLTTVSVSGPATSGTPITRDGRTVGTLLTRAGDKAIAYLRFDRADGVLKAGDATVVMGRHMPPPF